jgi:hypothetical protein
MEFETRLRTSQIDPQRLRFDSLDIVGWSFGGFSGYDGWLS